MVKKETEYIHSFKIDESRWQHGDEKENPVTFDSALRMDNGKMCCLGFFAQSCGAKVDSMVGICDPLELVRRYDSNKILSSSTKIKSILSRKDGRDRAEVDALIHANDNGNIPLESRKKKITNLFKKLKVKVEFYNSKEK